MWGYIIWAIILFILITMLVRMRSMYAIYVCSKCEHRFQLSALKEFFYPQVMYRKIARCPNCGKLVAAGIIKQEGKKENHKENHKESKKANKKR